MDPVIAGLGWELQRHPLFAALSSAELGRLLSAAHSIAVPSGKQIFAQGDESDCLYILLSGRVKISVFSESGKETVLAFMGENEVLGEMGVFDGGARSATAITLQDTRALRLSRADVIAFLERNPAVSLQIIATLCNRLRQTNVLTEEIATLHAGPRVAHALLRLSEVYGAEDKNGGVRIEIKLSQSNLGAHAGLTRENVNRQLKMLENEGLLKNEAGIITLLQLTKLKALSES